MSGPSGAGKTTLIDRVRNDLDPLGITLYFSVSHTTRRPRIGEADGKNYHFVSDETFRGMIERSEFLEWAHVHEQLYGTSKAEVCARLDAGQDVILDIDYQGAKQIDA
ncbi:MAG TPA: guanylate kinase, partial [Thermoanaerobaculia bacterium]|nr:guanylate kinase [Thermoanaerobaculia bacterium]